MKIAALLLALVVAAPLSVAQDMPVQEDTPTETAADEKIVVADDIVTALDAAGTFTILVDALRSTGLDAALSGTETFTLFAPTDEAFQKLPEGTLASLSADELVGILRYHVLAGTVTAADAAALAAAPTVEGTEVAIAANDGALAINDANVTESDIEVSNGVIHVVDTVLLPSQAIEGKAAGGQAPENMDNMESDATEQDGDAESDNTESDDTESGNMKEEGQEDVSEASPETSNEQR